MRWLFVGVKHRHKDVSYSAPRKDSAGVDMDDLGYKGPNNLGMSQAASSNNSTSHLPIATQFRASRFGRDQMGLMPAQQRRGDERAGLIQNAQPNPAEMSPPRNLTSGPGQYYDGSGNGSPPNDGDYVVVDMPREDQRAVAGGGVIHRPGSLSTVDEESLGWSRQGSRQDMYRHSPQVSRAQTPGTGGRNSTQMRVGEALWGYKPSTPQGQEHQDGEGGYSQGHGQGSARHD